MKGERVLSTPRPHRTDCTTLSPAVRGGGLFQLAHMLNVFLLKFRSNCKKNFLDTCAPSDKGRGKSCLRSAARRGRIQNATKRSPATYGHSRRSTSARPTTGGTGAARPWRSSAAPPRRDKPARPRGRVPCRAEGEAWVGLGVCREPECQPAEELSASQELPG